MGECFNNIYEGKKVFLTGHTGFKGGWLSLFLKKLGAEVLGYSLEPNTEPSFFRICEIEKEIKSVIGDIRDLDYLSQVMNNFNPDIIFHLAAQPLVRISYKEPKMTYETNVIGTLNVYEAARKCKSVKSIVTITTDKCYENKEWSYGYRESDPMGGYDPYSSSKGCVELLTASYRNSFFNDLGVKVATARAGNVIGGGDWAEDRLIPDFVRATAEGKLLLIRNPFATRPWQFVLEPLTGYLWLGALLLEGKSEYACGWNFGPNDTDILSVKELLDLSISNWGKGNYEIDKSVQPHEANLLKLDISNAKSKLKWRPVYDVETAVSKTISWYEEFYRNYFEVTSIDMKQLTIKQIEEYISVAKHKKILWGIK
ncbi:CDP-glucose 4,6-dehydratase [uncultured Clostridium sp.]|uniref:CDP-glucose 4,6-dehydratase n=1 Tax=uncultured Clostridium sp. TaxID=59620 RepID=UPI002600E0B1|nr:CDP-glucose 4,6-dehydratase [uncultured Clostridium sp.]